MLKVPTLIVLALAALGSVAGQNCMSAKTCAACSRIRGCDWISMKMEIPNYPAQYSAVCVTTALSNQPGTTKIDLQAVDATRFTQPQKLEATDWTVSDDEKRAREKRLASFTLPTAGCLQPCCLPPAPSSPPTTCVFFKCMHPCC